MENTNATTLPQAAELLVSTREQRGVSANYLVTLRAMLAKLARTFPGPLRDLSAGTVEDFLATLKPRTANNYLMLLRQLVAFVRRRKLLRKGWDELDAVERRLVPPVELNNGKSGADDVPKHAEGVWRSSSGGFSRVRRDAQEKRVASFVRELSPGGGRERGGDCPGGRP